MCEPTAILAGAGLAFSVGQQIAGAEAQNKAAAANEAAARRAFREQNKALAMLQQQEQDAAAVTIFDIERRARAAQALASVSAGEAGVTGQSVEDILSDLDRERGEAEVRIERNLSDRLAQIEREKHGARSIMENRIASVPRADMFGTFLGMLAPVAGFGSTMVELQRGKEDDV